jgi:hypothetical protein
MLPLWFSCITLIYIINTYISLKSDQKSNQKIIKVAPDPLHSTNILYTDIF